MSYPLLMAFLQMDPAQLVSLELDNIQDLGQLQDGKYFPSMLDLSATPESSKPNGIRHPGCMRGHLRQLEGRCVNLRHLSLRSVGQDDPYSRMWSSGKDEERYSEWGSFIESLKGTLVSLKIKQGTEPEDLREHSTRELYTSVNQFGQVGGPMDSQFLKLLLPVLARGPWSKLQSMTIIGVGGKTRRVVPKFYTSDSSKEIESMREGLSSVQLSKTSFIFKEEASKTFYLRRNGNEYETWHTVQLRVLVYNFIFP
jgi:hypothetical protein